MNPKENWHQIIASLVSRGKLSALGGEYVSHVVDSPPSRNPSNSSRRNLIVDFASRKMGHSMGLESLTVEAGYGTMLEIPLPCVGFWSQPKSVPVPSTGCDGISRRIWRTFDFLVIYPDRVELVECKTEAELIALSLENPQRFSRNEEGQWISPEAEAALKCYGIKSKVVSDADLNPKLLRNYTVLEEARQNDYSSPNALKQIQACFPKKDAGLPLADLISKAGREFTKNDVYFGILRRDLHVLLGDCLLVDDRTTQVFTTEYHAEVHRLLNYQTKPCTTQPLVIKQGSRLRWNGTEYSVCSASPEKFYLNSKNGEPTPISRKLFCSLHQIGEIELLDEVVFAETNHDHLLEKISAVLTEAKMAKAIKKKQFLEFLAHHPNARPNHFGLPNVSLRTIQRWKCDAHESVIEYDNPIWGLVDWPREGRPRDELPAEMRAEMTAIANELYFSKEERTLCYVWRQLRKRREERNLPVPSKGALRRHIARMKNPEDSTKARRGRGASYKLSSVEIMGKNWATHSDFPLKIAQMDGKTLDIFVVDDETGEVLGKPTLTLMALPHYGSAPIGWCLLFEPESYRSGTMALRDQINRYNEPVKFVVVDNGKAFNNTTFDKLIATLGGTKINRRPRDPRFASEMESIFRTIDLELIHNQAGNTKPLQQAREMSSEMHPNKSAVWTFKALYEWLEKYLFTLLWDAPSAALGTTPRLAFERDQKRAPSREGRFMVPPDQAKVAFFPEVKRKKRFIQPGRGVFVEGYYYWDELMAKPGIENTWANVRYDPYQLDLVCVAIGGKWIDSIARRAPELRNVTERTRHLQVIARRSLRNSHGRRREATHGVRLGELGGAMLEDEKLLREKRRVRAQEHSVNKNRGLSNDETTKQQTNNTGAKPLMPKLDFSHLRKST